MSRYKIPKKVAWLLVVLCVFGFMLSVPFSYMAFDTERLNQMDRRKKYEKK